MNYSIDFTKITLDQYKKDIIKKNFIPSRQILRDQAEIHFNAFKKAHIQNLNQLFSAISDKKTRTELLKDTLISDEYLVILLRELKSIQSKLMKLTEFNWIDKSTIDKVEKAGILNTKTLYEKLGKKSERKQFSKEHGISEKEIVELVKLSDLTRIQWVNSTFAHVLYEAGFDTVDKVAKADYQNLYDKVTLKNEELKLYKGKIGINDMKLCIEGAGFIDAEIEV